MRAALIAYTVGMPRLPRFVYRLAPVDRLEYRVLVIFCLASTLVLIPIAVNYFRSGMTGVSLGIGGLAAFYAMLGVWISHVRRTVPYNLVLALVATTATLLPVYMLGAVARPWIYPLILVNYYLLPRPIALGTNLIAAVVLVALLSREVGWSAVLHQMTVLTAVMFFAHVFVWAIDRREDELRRLSHEDPLTGLGNRRALEHAMKQAAARQQRSGLPLSLIMLDLDHFKHVNDAYGHACGDKVICAAAEMISERLRASDTVFRYGGEEFVILCDNTDAAGAQELAERLRSAAHRALVIGELTITLSAGVESLRPGESVANCLKRADMSLLAAKSGGRDRVYRGEAPVLEAPGE